MSKKHNFQKLDTDRAQFAVAVQDARDLVTSWMGSDFDAQDEQEEELPIKVLSSTTMGLGANPAEKFGGSNFTSNSFNASQSGQNAGSGSRKALEKLQKSTQKIQKQKQTQANNNNNNNNIANKRHQSVRPPLRIPESDSEEEEESRTSKTRAVKRISALDAYKQSKKKRKH